MRKWREDDRGAVLALVAVSLVGLLGIVGLALDSARAYVAKAELSRAVDAAALGGASALRLGQSAASQRIETLARANGIDPQAAGISFAYDFGTNEVGENTVAVTASRVVPTTFMRVLGWDQVDVASAAEATVPPLDVVLVLDQSGSLGREGAWDDLQGAAEDFTLHFDDSIDQMGLVSFHLRAVDRVPLGQPFRNAVTSAIRSMDSQGDTNTGEGLRFARRQLATGPVRAQSVRVVVFFTDGRPTAFRGSVDGEDRMMAVPTTERGTMRGYWDDPDALPVNSLNSADGCRGATTCFGWNSVTIRDEGRQSGVRRADELRGDGVFVYTIGLGNPNASDPILVPDMDYLRLLANEGGVADSGQPKGKAYFAPSADDLDLVFDAVAQDLLVRLTR